MNNLKISTRLSVLIGFLALLLVAISSVGLYGMSQSNDAMERVYTDRTVPIGNLGDIEVLMLANRVALATAEITPTPEVIAASLATVDKDLADIDRLWKAYMATSLTPDEARLAASFRASREAYIKNGLEPTLLALKGGNAEEAPAIAVSRVRPLSEPMVKALHDLKALQVTEARREFEAAKAAYTTILTVSITCVVLGLVAASVFGLLISRSVTRPIQQAVQLAQAVAAGDLTTRIDVKTTEETGQLLSALKTMSEGLIGIVGNVRQSSDSIATGSAQIATGNADLSQRTEEQASNLQQTAASMEQLTATVKQNADTAQQASRLAISASDAATKGGQVVSQVVGTMEQITASSKKISDIIGVIDGIAFQTNILALNAAVEAARAGEQGRGFAVVASEVRSLAQRSANAAKEIKTLIGESVAKVETGSALVDHAGQSMDDIVHQVKRVNDLIAEISSASIEQTQGIGQVGDAVNQLDQVTQQNAALVEESAAAAESLRHQAARLADVVGVFRLNA